VNKKTGWKARCRTRTKSNVFRVTRMGSGRAKNEKGALVGYVSSAPVATENATSRGAEAQCKSDESTECEPISIAVL